MHRGTVGRRLSWWTYSTSFSSLYTEKRLWKLNHNMLRQEGMKHNPKTLDSIFSLKAHSKYVNISHSNFHQTIIGGIFSISLSMRIPANTAYWRISIHLLIINVHLSLKRIFYHRLQELPHHFQHVQQLWDYRKVRWHDFQSHSARLLLWLVGLPLTAMDHQQDRSRRSSFWVWAVGLN